MPVHYLENFLVYVSEHGDQNFTIVKTWLCSASCNASFGVGRGDATLVSFLDANGNCGWGL